MSFALIPQVPPSSLRKAADLRLAVHLNGKARTPLLVAAFSSTALVRAGLPLGSMLTLSRGTGPDDGKIQIGLGRDGLTRKLISAGKGGAGTVRFTIPDGWLRPARATEAEIEFGARRAVIALLPPELLLSIATPAASGDVPPGVETVATAHATPDAPLPAAEAEQKAAVEADEGHACDGEEETVPAGARYTAGEKRTALALLGAGASGREVAHELGLDLRDVSEWAANMRIAKAAKGRRAA